MNALIGALAVLAAGHQASATFLGPIYPSPIDLTSEQSLIPAAWQNFTDQLDTYLSNAALPPQLSQVILNASWSVNLFSANDPKASVDFNYHHTGLESKNAVIGTKDVNSESLYRVASVTKMATVYVAKLAFKEEMWNRPLSDFMPEFSAQVEQQGLSPGLNATRWNEITPFALASQISGLPTALTGLFGSTGDTFVTTFNASFDQWIASGMPSSFTEKQLNDPKITPECVLSGDLTSCTSEGHAISLAWRDAFRLPFTEPNYSNAGFILFGIVMERLTNKTIAQLYQEHLIGPLGLESTFIVFPGNETTQNCKNCVVTEGLVQFSGQGTPSWSVASGGLYTTLDELTVIGSSILNSTLLSPVETRKWLKPVSHTSNLEYSVGTPWEIARYINPFTGKITDIYPKNGDSGSAASQFALVPDYDAGFIILLSSSVLASRGINKSIVVATIADLLLDTMMPALEAQAAKEALQNYAGTYTALNLNSSITVTQTQEHGLNVTEWISNGTNLCTKPFSAELLCPFSIQQSNDLRSSSSAAGQVAFRTSALPSGILASAEAASQGLGLFSRQFAVSDWFFEGTSYTAGIGTDLFIFNVAEGGKATSISPAALRITLDKQA